MAQNFEGMVRMDRLFEVVVPRNFSTVCFRVSPAAIGGDGNDQEAANVFNAGLLERINESGKIYMMHAVIGGVYVMRFAVGASLTENRHVNDAWKVIQERVDQLLTKYVDY
ncbi:tyrosine/dopa decarboxylase 1 [Phtheirospermum japonicum]|uniref:Tyrosine/dopa decarboxylase 1 n=1 Tax=Phtheirospermum japonicum TaxID=374723 RepID=A0A830D1I6_9LAMI|nr:tyrosine/dopa decarboxylase 1 [Phtheirospermum japonicum]